MAGATGRVDQGQRFGVELTGRDGRKLRLDLVGLLSRLDVVFHLPLERRVRVGRQPLRAQRVLHHVLHDPVGREKLCRGRNVFRLHHIADHLVLFLRDVELVEPADDLDLLPLVFVDAFDQLADQRVGVQQVGGQEQFGLVADALEEKGHGLVQGVALRQQQQPVELFVFGAVQLQSDGPGTVQTRQLDIGGVVEDLRAALACGMAQHPVAVVEIAVQLHVADGHEAVEPGVGDGLHGGVEAVGVNPLNQTAAGLGNGRREGLAADDQHIPLHLGRLGALGADAEPGRLRADRDDEGTAGCGGVGLEGRDVHGGVAHLIRLCRRARSSFSTITADGASPHTLTVAWSAFESAFFSGSNHSFL